jgi:hypothetical protein
VFDQLGVDFDGDDAGGAPQQLFRQRTAARTDFNHQVFARGTNGYGNTLQNTRVCEEVLTEFLRQDGR